MNNRYLVGLLACILLLIAGCSSNQSTDSSLSSIDRIYSLDPQRKLIGETVNDFHFIDLVTGEQVHFDEVYKDKVVMIQSFSVGCPACVQGIKDFNYFYDKYGDEIEVIYMDISSADSSELILSTKEQFDGRDWLWTEHQGSLLPFYEQMNFYMNDMTVIVDKSGKIAYADSFVVPLARLENALVETI